VRSVARLVRLGQWRSAGVALACAGLFMSAASLYSLQQYARHALTMAAHSLAFAGEPAIRFRDLEALRELAEQLAEREQLASVTVLDARGQRLLRVERAGQGAFDALARRVAELFMPQAVTAPVAGGGLGTGELGEVQLRSDGRVLLRSSGTEPVIRVMVEARSSDVAQRITDQLAQVVQTSLPLR
jgi:phosphomannomutase